MNLRPLPCQQTTGNRCAPGRSPRSPSTVDGEVKCSLGVQLSGLSFATSYGALYAYARDIGLYCEHLTRLWTLLLDGAFIVAQLAAMLAGILRGSRGWPVLTMLLTGAQTVWFNLQQAGGPGRGLAATLPPVLMMLALEIDVQIVKCVMRALGKWRSPNAMSSRSSTSSSPQPRPSASGGVAPAGHADDWSRAPRRWPGAGCIRCPSPAGSRRTTWRPRRRCWERCWQLGGPGRDDAGMSRDRGPSSLAIPTQGAVGEPRG